MGKQFNVYEEPLTKEQYDYLKLHCKDYLISENEKMFGPVGQVEGAEWSEEDLDAKNAPTAEPPTAYEPPEVVEDWAEDDVKFVDGFDYAQKQAWLKENGLSAQGDKVALRQRMLEALADSDEEDDGEEEEEQIQD